MKIDSGDLGAINFKNMLPVTDNNIIKLDLDKECLKNKYYGQTVMIRRYLPGQKIIKYIL